jgi:cell division septation protein DedD
MSKIYDALQKAEVDRTTYHDQQRSDTHERGSDAPSSEITGWRKGLIVGGIGGFLTAALIVPSVIEAMRSSVPPASAVERGETAQDDVVSVALVAAPVQAPQDVDGGLESATVALDADDASDGTGAAPRDGTPATLAKSAEALPFASRSGRFWVQVGAFKDRDNAVRLLARLASGHHAATIGTGGSPAAPWVLRVGAYADRGAAEGARLALAREGHPGFVVAGESSQPAMDRLR